MDRITKKNLQALCDSINRAKGTPLQPYGERTEDNRCNPQANCYHLSGAYGGYALHQMCETGSGVRDVFGGHMPKRELWDRMQAYLSGIQS